MSSGPSKQELEMYWQNSRQYFDELAKHYQQADPAYYKEYIEPFYSNPFRTSAGTGQNRSGAMPVMVIAGLLLVAAAGVAVFIMFYFSSGSDSKNIENIFNPEDKREMTDDKNITGTQVDSIVNLVDNDFITGSKYLAEKDYDKAEYHFKKIKPGDKYYKESQQILKNMKFLREHNK